MKFIKELNSNVEKQILKAFMRLLSLNALKDLEPSYEKKVISLSQATLKIISQSVQKMSDYYIKNPKGKTPWGEEWAKMAQICYYLPLNYLRSQAVINEAKRVGFFDGLDCFIEVGSGLGALTANLITFNNKISLDWGSTKNKSNHHNNRKNLIEPRGQKGEGFNESAASERRPEPSLKGYCLERSKDAIEISKEIFHLKSAEFISENQLKTLLKEAKRNDANEFSIDSKGINLRKTFAAFSYVLTELEKIPSWVFDCEGFIIIEPSTSEDSRRLMALRQEFINKGFTILAPCTHQGKCPLLVHSKKDWCHDRVHLNMPKWFLEMEKHLKIKNSTITYSYLIGRKNGSSGLNPFDVEDNTQELAGTVLPSVAPVEEIKQDYEIEQNAEQGEDKKLAKENYFRVIGDMLEEKGKTKVLVCRGEDREFISWLRKDKLDLEIHRGDLIKINSSNQLCFLDGSQYLFEKKSNELRLIPQGTQNNP